MAVLRGQPEGPEGRVQCRHDSTGLCRPGTGVRTAYVRRFSHLRILSAVLESQTESPFLFPRIGASTARTASRVSLRIAFDLDGVLADMESAFLREAAALFGPSATEAAPPTERPPNEPQDKSTSADADLPEDDPVPAPPVPGLRLT